jgi:hypothetical protein
MRERDTYTHAHKVEDRVRSEVEVALRGVAGALRDCIAATDVVFDS